MNLHRVFIRTIIILLLIVMVVLSFLLEDIPGWGQSEIGGILDGFGLSRLILIVCIIFLPCYWLIKSTSNKKSEKFKDSFKREV